MNYSKKIKTYKLLKLLSFLLFIITFIFIIFKLFLGMFLVNVMSSEKYKITEPISFLIMGSDYRTDTSNPNFSGARADALIVVTLNPNNSRDNIETNIVSIPRDTLSYIPCGPTEDYYDKINSALNYGLEENGNIEEGIDCTVEAVEFLMNIKIDYYVMATFEGVMHLIDAIDGIKINSPYAFCTQDADGNGYTESENLRLLYGTSACDQTSLDAGAISFEQGLQDVNGEEALAYARQRYSSSDYERNMRQQQVISAVIKKILSNPDQYATSFIKVFINDFYTNIETNNLWNYINFATSLYNNIEINLSNDVPVYIDIKSSQFENSQSTNNWVFSSNPIEPIPMSEYYPAEQLDSFEQATYISRNYITKEAAGSASNLVEIDSTELKPIVIELSSYSIKSLELENTSNTYFDYSTLYYTSNLLRKAYNLPVEDPKYDYSLLGIYDYLYFDPLINYDIYLY